MGQSKSKSNIKYAKLPCPSSPSKNVDSEDELDIEIGNLKKSDEKSEAVKTFSKKWYIGVGFATISGEV